MYCRRFSIRRWSLRNCPPEHACACRSGSSLFQTAAYAFLLRRAPEPLHPHRKPQISFRRNAGCVTKYTSFHRQLCGMIGKLASKESSQLFISHSSDAIRVGHYSWDKFRALFEVAMLVTTAALVFALHPVASFVGSDSPQHSLNAPESAKTISVGQTVAILPFSYSTSPWVALYW